VDAILIFFVILSTLAGLAASAATFGVDSRDQVPAERTDHRA
jgi:hypothetical protein